MLLFLEAQEWVHLGVIVQLSNQKNYDRVNQSAPQIHIRYVCLLQLTLTPFMAYAAESQYSWTFC